MLPDANIISGSATLKVVESTVVVVPLTVRLPAIVTLLGNPMFILLSETVVSISLAVPSKVKVSVPIVTVSLEPLSAAMVNEELILAVEAAVIRPVASTVNTGIAVEPPYDPAVTAVSSRSIDNPLPDAVVVIPVSPVIAKVSACSITPEPESPLKSKSKEAAAVAST